MNFKNHPQNLVEGTKTHIDFAVDENAMDTFATLSGDRNSLHLDSDFARRHGFKDRVVYGGLLVAAISRIIGMDLPGDGWVWHTVTMKFHNALYIGETVQITACIVYANLDLGVLRLSILGLRGNDKIIQGEVQVGRLNKTEK